MILSFGKSMPGTPPRTPVAASLRVTAPSSSTASPMALLSLDSLDLSGLYASPIKSTSYLRTIVEKFAYGAEIWRMYTSVPESYSLDCKNLEILILDLAQHCKQKNIQNTGFAQNVNKLAENMYNFLFGNCGIYYTITERDPDACEKFVYHIGHTLIHEARFNTALGGKPHNDKVELIFKNSINLLERLQKLSEAVTALNVKYSDYAYKNHSTLLGLIQKFMVYVSWQMTALEAALEYAAAAADTNSADTIGETKTQAALKALAIAKSIIASNELCCHPADNIENTPQKMNTPAKRVRESHASGGLKHVRCLPVEDEPETETTSSCLAKPRF